MCAQYRWHIPGTHRAPAVPGTGFHLSVPQILLPRETHRGGNNPLRSLARSHAHATSLSLSSSSSSRLPDNAFCVRNALYGRGGAAFYRFYIARLTTFDEANRMKNIHLPSERANCLRGSRARTSRLRHDKLIIFILSTSLVFPFLFFFSPEILPLPPARLLRRLEKDSLSFFLN